MSWYFLCGHFIDQTSLSSFFRHISAPTSSSRGPFTTSMSCRLSPTCLVRRPGSRISTLTTTSSAPDVMQRWSGILSSFYGNVSKHSSHRRLSRSLELHPCIRSHGILYLLPGFISGVALLLLGYSSKKQETRISLLLMLFLELTPNWATILMKTARLHRTLLTNTVTASYEMSTGIGLSSQWQAPDSEV